MYDLIVIGGGPAGYMAAERAGAAGLKVLLVEKLHIGGVCLNEGCIPTKTLLYSAKIYDSIKTGEKYGVTAQDAVLNHAAVIDRKNKMVKILTAGVKAGLKKSNVEIVEGEAKIVGKIVGKIDEESTDDSVEGFKVAVGGLIYEGKRLLIAAGSTPYIPSVAGMAEAIEKGYALTSTEILDLRVLPKSLLIIGGGVIGLELASYFNSAGSKVTVVEMLDHIAGNTDRQIASILMKNYSKKGVDFRLNARLVEISEGYVVCVQDTERFTLEAEKVLVCVGRKPASTGLGLETIGVELNGLSIRTDARGMTNVSGVYAAGDVNGVSMLAHTAYREAEVCINNILGKEDKMRYDTIPSVIYTNPEVASIGETEETAAAKGIDFEAADIPMRMSGRYLAENEGGDGICRILVDRQSRKLLGVHMVGNYSSEIIYGAGIMMETDMRVEDIKRIVFPHPTVGEVIREGIFSFEI